MPRFNLPMPNISVELPDELFRAYADLDKKVEDMIERIYKDLRVEIIKLPEHEALIKSHQELRRIRSGN